MNKQEKYELIIKIKELLIETEKVNIKKRTSILQISLIASKVLNLVFSNDVLNIFFQQKLKIFLEIKNNWEDYIKACELRKQQILSMIPIRDRNKIDFSQDDFVFDINYSDAYTSKNYIQDFMLYNCYEPFSIFTYIDLYFVDKYNNYWSSLDDSTEEYKEYDIAANSILDTAFHCMGDDNVDRINIAENYDYYYVHHYERFLNNIPNEIYILQYYFLHIAYSKILQDLLSYLYEFDEEGENKIQNIENKQKISINFDKYDDLKELTSAQRTLLNCFVNCKTRDDIEKYGLVYTQKSLKTMIYKISSYFKDKGLLSGRGGFNAIQLLIFQHPEWYQ